MLRCMYDASDVGIIKYVCMHCSIGMYACVGYISDSGVSKYVCVHCSTALYACVGLIIFQILA